MWAAGNGSAIGITRSPRSKDIIWEREKAVKLFIVDMRQKGIYATIGNVVKEDVAS
jgi:hypothetical protein